MMSEVYEVGGNLFEDMTEMLLNNKNISNDQRRGLREAYVLSKREEYCLIPLRLTSAILKEYRCHFIPQRCDDIGIYMTITAM